MNLDKNTEEVLELVWTIKERGETVVRDTVMAESKVEKTDGCLEELAQKGLVVIEGDNVTMTGEGEEMGSGIVRRQRLAEWLLSNVLDLEPKEWEGTACELEHILSREVTDSICTFIGHPPLCPHGKRIPRGECCKRFSKEVRPLVLNVTELAPGERGKIVFIAPKHHDRLDRLGSFGLVPGTVIRLHQKQPAYVIYIGETSIAIDHEIAGDIYVKKTGA